MRYSILFFIVFAYSLCYSQGWQRHFRMPHTTNNYTKAIFETSPGHYIAFGTSYDTTNGGLSNKLRVIGMGNSGQVLWSKQYGDTNLYYYDNAYGYPYGFKKGNNIFFVSTVQHDSKVCGSLIKLDANGDTLWQRIYTDSINRDVGLFRMNESVDGGFLLTGFSQNWDNHTQPCLVIKTDALGQELWRKKIHKVAPDVTWGYAVIQDSASKRIVIGGFQYIGTAIWSTYDNILVLDSLGNKIGQTNYLGMGGMIYDLIQTRDKSIIAVGAKTYSLDGYQRGINRSFIVKFDTSAILSSYSWINEYQELGQNSAYSCVQELPNGDLLAGGQFDTSFFNNRDFNYSICIDRWDKNGNLIKQDRHHYKFNSDPLENQQTLLCLNPTTDGGFIAAIQTQYFSPDQLFFVKYDSLFCDSSQAYCAQIATGINNAGITNEGFIIYPNPVSNQLNIDLGNSKETELVLSISDLSGREIKSYLLQNNKLDVGDIAPGLYVVHISNEEGRILQTARLIKK